jgi:hypothetical protein
MLVAEALVCSRSAYLTRNRYLYNLSLCGYSDDVGLIDLVDVELGASRDFAVQRSQDYGVRGPGFGLSRSVKIKVEAPCFQPIARARARGAQLPGPRPMMVPERFPKCP